MNLGFRQKPQNTNSQKEQNNLLKQITLLGLSGILALSSSSCMLFNEEQKKEETIYKSKVEISTNLKDVETLHTHQTLPLKVNVKYGFYVKNKDDLFHNTTAEATGIIDIDLINNSSHKITELYYATNLIEFSHGATEKVLEVKKGFSLIDEGEYTLRIKASLEDIIADVQVYVEDFPLHNIIKMDDSENYDSNESQDTKEYIIKVIQPKYSPIIEIDSSDVTNNIITIKPKVIQYNINFDVIDEGDRIKEKEIKLLSCKSEEILSNDLGSIEFNNKYGFFELLAKLKTEFGSGESNAKIIVLLPKYSEQYLYDNKEYEFIASKEELKKILESYPRLIEDDLERSNLSNFLGFNYVGKIYADDKNKVIYEIIPDDKFYSCEKTYSLFRDEQLNSLLREFISTLTKPVLEEILYATLPNNINLSQNEQIIFEANDKTYKLDIDYLLEKDYKLLGIIYDPSSTETEAIELYNDTYSSFGQKIEPFSDSEKKIDAIEKLDRDYSKLGF